MRASSDVSGCHHPSISLHRSTHERSASRHKNRALLPPPCPQRPIQRLPRPAPTPCGWREPRQAAARQEETTKRWPEDDEELGGSESRDLRGLRPEPRPWILTIYPAYLIPTNHGARSPLSAIAKSHRERVLTSSRPRPADVVGQFSGGGGDTRRGYKGSRTNSLVAFCRTWCVPIRQGERKLPAQSLDLGQPSAPTALGTATYRVRKMVEARRVTCIFLRRRDLPTLRGVPSVCSEATWRGGVN